jgi:hypothetical protein
MYEPTITSGARVIRLKLKTSSLKTFGLVDPPPLIRMKPKVSKLMISSKIMYLFFAKIMLFLISTRQKQKVQINAKKTGKRIYTEILLPENIFEPPY